MAKIELLIQAQDNASKQLANVESEMKKLTAGSKTLGSSFGGLNGAITALVGSAGFMALKSAINSCIDEAKEQAMVNRQLEAVLKSTGGAVGYTSRQIQDMAGKMQYQVGIADDVIQSGQNMLLTFTNIGHDVFPEATRTMLDMATAMNGGVTPGAEQLRGTAIQLGKALQDPILGMTALRRVGVDFNEESKKTVENFLRHNDLMSAQKYILAELSKEFGGSALAQATISKKMQVALGELKESIGNNLVPAINKFKESMIPLIEHLTEWINKNPGLVKGIASILGVLASLILYVTTLAPAFKMIGTLFSPISQGFGMLAKGIGTTSNALLGFIGIATTAVTVMSKLGNYFGQLASKQKEGSFSKELFSNLEALNPVTGFKKFKASLDAYRGIKPAVETTPSPEADLGNQALNYVAPDVSGMVKSTGDSSGIKEQKKAVEDLAKSMKEMGFVDQAVSEASINAKNLNKNAIEELGTYYKSLKTHAQESFDAINDKIKTSTEKIFDYKQSIIDLNKQINDLKGEQNTDVAKSYVESVQKIKQLQEEINSGSASSDASKQLASEQANIQSAFAGLSDAERATLQAKIDKETEYQAMTGIEKIRADSSEKIALIQAEIAEKTKGIADETAKINELNTQKATLEKNRMNTLKLDHTAQIKMYDELIAKARELASARSSVGVSATTPATPATTKISGAKANGGPVNGGSTYLVGENGPELFTPAWAGNITPNDKIGGANVSINLGGVVINNEADENKLVEKISNALIRQIDLYKLGVY